MTHVMAVAGTTTPTLVPAPWILITLSAVIATALIVGIAVRRSVLRKHEERSDAAASTPATDEPVSPPDPPSPEESVIMTTANPTDDPEPPRSDPAPQAEDPAPQGDEPDAEVDEPAAFTPDDRVAHEDASMIWPDAQLLAEPPADYVPLEVPEIWEPDEGAADEPAWAEPTKLPPAGWSPPYAGTPSHPTPPAPPASPYPQTYPAPWAQAAQPNPQAAPPPGVPTPQPPSFPLQQPPPRRTDGYVIQVPELGSTTGSVPTGNIPGRSSAPSVPRSFRDLRTGPLAGREFASMRDFAVAAVLEAGYAEADVARLFRFQPWQLRAWVEEARRPGPTPR